MTTTALSPAVVAPPRVGNERTPRDRKRALLAGVVVALAALGAGAWLTIDRAAGGSAAGVSPAAWASQPAWTFAPWLARLDAIGLKRHLVRAGYSIRIDGVLGPVAKSALADYLRPDSAHPLAPSLVQALDGTVITGSRDPVAWNERFGLARKTKFVERPLTGPGGQLDANGNLRMISR